MTMSLDHTLAEELCSLGGQELNIGLYEIPRSSWVPRIEGVLVNELAAQGSRVPPITTTGTAIAKVPFDATNGHCFRSPMIGDRVRQAIANLKPSL